VSGDGALGGTRTHGLLLRRQTLYPLSYERSNSGEHPQTARWPIRLGRKSKPVLLLFGARESNSYVDLGEQLEAHFGLYRMSTPVANIARWRIEGPWSWFTAIGVRRGIRDGVASFGGNHVESVT
jgi:hypothetical protein